MYCVGFRLQFGHFAIRSPQRHLWHSGTRVSLRQPEGRASEGDDPLPTGPQAGPPQRIWAARPERNANLTNELPTTATPSRPRLDLRPPAFVRFWPAHLAHRGVCHRRCPENPTRCLKPHRERLRNGAARVTKHALPRGLGDTVLYSQLGRPRDCIGSQGS